MDTLINEIILFKDLIYHNTQKSKTMYFIEFLSKKHNYKTKRQYFDDWGRAIEWGLKNLDNFNVNMIRCTPNKSR